MKYIWTVLLATTVLLGYPPSVLGQNSEGQLTIKELRETKRLLAIFGQRLEETNDIEQAIQAVAAKDWFENVLRQVKKSGVADLEAAGFSQALLINHPREYRRAWLALHNLTHLLLLNAAARTPEDDEEDFSKFIPPEVMQIFQHNRYWAEVLKEINGETANARDLEITTYSELLDVSFIAEHGNQLLRTSLQTLNLEAQEKMQERLATHEEEMGSEPGLHICNEECASLPNGTRTVVMNYLMFQLTFAKVGGEMRLVLIASRIGE